MSWVDHPGKRRPESGSLGAGTVEMHTHQRPPWPPSNLEPHRVRTNSTSHPTGEPGLMGESFRGTEHQAWGSAKPDQRGLQIVSKSRKSPAQIQEAPASGLLHPQKDEALGWTQFPVILWMFPDLYEHRLQY